MEQDRTEINAWIILVQFCCAGLCYVVGMVTPWDTLIATEVSGAVCACPF